MLVDKICIISPFDIQYNTVCQRPLKIVLLSENTGLSHNILPVFCYQQVPAVQDMFLEPTKTAYEGQSNH